ncbi:unnamed protein product [Sphagnum compactum]
MSVAISHRKKSSSSPHCCSTAMTVQFANSFLEQELFCCTSQMSSSNTGCSNSCNIISRICDRSCCTMSSEQ